MRRVRPPHAASRDQEGAARRLLRDWLASDECVCDLTRIVVFEENYADALASSLAAIVREHLKARDDEA